MGTARDSENTSRSLDEDEQIARIAKLNEEVAYLRVQRRLYPIVVTSGVSAAAVAFIKLVF